MKTALIHYWLINMRGGEKVIQTLAEIYPEAVLYSNVVERKALSPELANRDIHTTFIQRLPQAARRYQQYLPLMPLALEQLDLRNFDLVISSESGPAKGVIVHPGATHICYCHSPMRYIWDMYHDYMRKASFPVRLLMRPLCHYLRMCDQLSSMRVDQFVANSRYVAERIRNYYGRQAHVIAPPVNIEDFQIISEKSDFYLFFGELVAYKRAELAIESFRGTNRKLVVAGKGEQLEYLKKIAPPNVTFTGSLTFPQVKQYLANAKALIFPGVEDFGIIPVEAMASGTPVIAFKKGGVLDSILDNQTGIFFQEQTVPSLISAIDKFEAGDHAITLTSLKNQSAKFSVDQFVGKFTQVVNSEMARKNTRLTCQNQFSDFNADLR